LAAGLPQFMRLMAGEFRGHALAWVTLQQACDAPRQPSGLRCRVAGFCVWYAHHHACSPVVGPTIGHLPGDRISNWRSRQTVRLFSLAGGQKKEPRGALGSHSCDARRETSRKQRQDRDRSK
jgi:hypothetical protein